MALSRERIADEVLKLLGLPDPAATVAIMLQRSILKPVLPEIEPERLRQLEALIVAEQQADIAPDPLRRLSALLPRDENTAEKVAARLKLSTDARKRLGCAATPDLPSSAQVLAYRAGTRCAVDRLLLGGKTREAAAIVDWQAPRLPIGGGVLIARGVPRGPLVAQTLRRIEDRWVEAGFPRGDRFDQIVAAEIGAATT